MEGKPGNQLWLHPSRQTGALPRQHSYAALRADKLRTDKLTFSRFDTRGPLGCVATFGAGFTPALRKAFACFNYQMELSVLHATHRETGIVLKLTQAFQPVQIPTAFEKAFLQGMLLRIANISRKSPSIKSLTCKRERIDYIPTNHFYCSHCKRTYWIETATIEVKHFCTVHEKWLMSTTKFHLLHSWFNQKTNKRSHTHRPILSKGSYLYFFLKCIVNLIYSPDVLHHSIFVKKVSTTKKKQKPLVREDNTSFYLILSVSCWEAVNCCISKSYFVLSCQKTTVLSRTKIWTAEYLTPRILLEQWSPIWMGLNLSRTL